MKIHWEKIATIESDEHDSWDIDYCRETKEYRVSLFKDYHYQTEVIFPEINKCEN